MDTLLSNEEYMKYTFNNLRESNIDSENYGKPISVDITFRQWLAINFKAVKKSWGIRYEWRKNLLRLSKLS